MVTFAVGAVAISTGLVLGGAVLFVAFATAVGEGR